MDFALIIWLELEMGVFAVLFRGLLGGDGIYLLWYTGLSAERWCTVPIRR